MPSDPKFSRAQLAYLRETLSEGFHAGFRKASDHPKAGRIWQLIRALPDEDYGHVIDFVVDGIAYSTGSKT